MKEIQIKQQSPTLCSFHAGWICKYEPFYHFDCLCGGGIIIEDIIPSNDPHLMNLLVAETIIGPVKVGEFTRIQADIFLNANVLPNASQEIIVSTILHEVLHAYLGYSRSSSLFNDHEEMANEYINLMMTSLQNLFPNMSNKDAEALSWGGLHKTSAWQNLVNGNPTKANEITQINKDYADGNKGTGCL